MSDHESEGENPVTTRMGIENGEVVIFWSELIATIRFDPDSADQFADAIKEKAQEARNLTN
ncbi:MAG: hypothetical protein IID46_01650 [Planctomycetes bacterium]|nr:hypothetical protein [Planctomycetota bacterium]